MKIPRRYSDCFAHKLTILLVGTSQHNISTWVARSTFDSFYIKAAFPEVSVDWLLTSEAEMLIIEHPKVIHI